MDFIEILEKHYKTYPEMQLDDMVKLTYQNEFGCGHMVFSPKESLKNLENEVILMKNRGISEDKTEDIGNGYVRMYLGLADRLSPEIINKMFVLSANNGKGTEEGFLKKKEILKSFAYEKFDCEIVDRYFKDYDKTGEVSNCHHSKIYNDAYHPFYRVVLAEFGEYLRVFEEIYRLLQRKPNAVISIDGPAGSGKTHLASLISNIFPCNPVHTDDFFLPMARKTKERMEEAGGNFDYERFFAEIVSPLKDSAVTGFDYGVFHCKQQKIVGNKEVNKAKMTLVEGSYCHHTLFGDWCDLNIYLDTPEDICYERLVKRESPEMLAKFEEMWIPLERKYFTMMNVKERCNIII